MTEQRVKIEGTKDTDVAYALAYLAGFRKGTFVSRIRNIWYEKLSSKCAVVFHKETIRKAGSLQEAMLCFGPDIIVSQVHKRPENSPVFQSTDEYLIDFKEDKVNSALVTKSKLEKEIRLAYAQK